MSLSKKSIKEAARKERKEFRKKVIEDKKKLIRQIERRHGIWDRNSKEYKHNRIVDDLWLEVAACMGWTKEECKRTWKNLVDHFRELLSHVKVLSGTGQSADSTIKWVFFSNMLFMRSMLEGKSSSANMKFEPVELLELQMPQPASFDNELDGEFTPSSILPTDGELEETKPLNGHLEDTQNSQDSEHREDPDESNSYISDASVSRIPAPESCVTKSQSSTEEILVHELGSESREPGIKRDRSSSFGDYVRDLMRLVPEKKQRKCELTILEVINAYADGLSPNMEIKE